MAIGSTDNSCRASAVRRIACISTSRADAGIYRSLFRALTSRSEWQVACLAGGTHSSEDFGRTIADLRRHENIEVILVDHLMPGDAPISVATTAGRAVIEFSKALAQARPDLVIVLGDRTEMLAATLAAVIHRVPIAHLHGGESTEGAYDDQCRHAITKLSHIHLVALPEYAARIEAMGEAPWRIHTVGALALDEIAAFDPEPVDELSAVVGIDFSKPTFVVVFHAETMAPAAPRDQIGELLQSLEVADANFLLIGTNADVGYGAIDEATRNWASRNPRAAFVASLPQAKFWSCLAHARALIGNSSAGIIEAASFKLPVVNVGNRQGGRIRPPNVIDVPTRAGEIGAAIQRAASPEFRAGLAGLRNPYGDGRAAERIASVLRALPTRADLLKNAGPTAR